MTHNKKLTSTQIAKLAGVARSTVSKVINNYPDIPEATKQKVMAVIEQHNYKPNVFSSALKGIPQKIITLYLHTTANDSLTSSMGNLDSSYVMSVMTNFIYCASQQGYLLQVEVINESDCQESVLKRIKATFNERLICAAVFLGLTDNATFIDRLAEQGYKVFSIDRIIDDSLDGFNVTTDDFNGSYEATRLFLDRGLTEISFIGGDFTKLSARQREAGYRAALKEANITPDVIPCGYSELLARSIAEDLLKRGAKPEAIVCASDIIAYGIIKVCGREFLENVKLIGFDDLPFNEYQQPPLSSVAVDFHQMAEDTIKAIIDGCESKRIIAKTQLRNRL
ncbi:LacI family transcriptional regulator [Vibrio sinensis]|uniref:LacI family transcriptional regulator n=1 Tax=Vibrio sinensis TaxID=2302434 RepID=A0A3A6QML8_9VIBR|nr:LacI family DNA-binding transcriptional regulator [Vibrio sinensis]RJX69405.1 LacI family transcriptional regulator [Vibrio sinensis]